ncbi:hypothetical protein PoB_000343000 [Plakobranchus ocellatus]|uniref:Uncharacterized protein n=1 Tax=Plakobranchus ocellatus TaxID=259542 RepID=A0AAV3Y1I0_9GAST|nr:hypothetical protein PoB_000343000 [Plakobranchus ocellatus]
MEEKVLVSSSANRMQNLQLTAPCTGAHSSRKMMLGLDWQSSDGRITEIIGEIGVIYRMQRSEPVAPEHLCAGGRSRVGVEQTRPQQGVVNQIKILKYYHRSPLGEMK